jgi:hypothetical protein
MALVGLDLFRKHFATHHEWKRRSKISPRNRSGEPVVAETNQAITLRIELRGAVIPVVG